MKRLITLCILIFILAMTFAPLLSVPSYAYDFNQVPCINSVEVIPKVAYSGSTVTIRASASNLDPDKAAIEFLYAPPGYKKLEEDMKSTTGSEHLDQLMKQLNMNGKFIKVTLKYDKTFGCYIGSFPISLGNEAGKWELFACSGSYPNDAGSDVNFGFFHSFAPKIAESANYKPVNRYHDDPEQASFTVKACLLRDLKLFPIMANDKYGYINETGEVIIVPHYKWASGFGEDLAPVMFGNLFGYLNKSGQHAITPQFDQADSFSEGLAGIKKNEKFGYIDTTGKLMIETKFDFAGKFNKGIACVKTGNKFGFINTSGKFVIQPGYDNASDFSEDLAGVCLGNKWGYINSANKIIIPPKYEGASRLREGLAPVVWNNRVGYIDKQGKIVIQPKFNVPETLSLCEFSEGLAVVKINGLYGFIDKTGKMVIKPRFKSVLSGFSNGIASVTSDSERGYINIAGGFIWKVKL